MMETIGMTGVDAHCESLVCQKKYSVFLAFYGHKYQNNCSINKFMGESGCCAIVARHASSSAVYASTHPYKLAIKLTDCKDV